MLSSARSGAPLTRRQMREMEREAEAQAARLAVRAPNVSAETAPTPAETARTPAETAPPAVSMGAAPSREATIVMRPTISRRDLRNRPSPHREFHSAGSLKPHVSGTGSAAPRSRRELRASQTSGSSHRVSRVSDSRGVSRAALLGSLGVVTIAGPMTGFASPSIPAEALGPTMEVPLTELAATSSAAHILEGTIPSATGLSEEPFARLLAGDFASRAQAHTVVNGCEPSQMIAANGIAEVYTERLDVPFRPMAEGTYRDSSFFGPRWGSLHTGTDMAAPVGTPLYAVADGTVVHAGEGRDGRSGSLVIIHSEVNGEDTWFWYGHMFPEHIYVGEGDQVTAGQVIAGVGNSGRSTGPHLHFEIHPGEWGNAVDPLVWLEAKSASFPGQC